jgi:predicted DNA-binding transcriptional regulator AlpA
MSDITLLTSRRLAELLDCSERTLERRREEGDGPPYVKIGGVIRYPLSELERWLADNTRRSTSEPAASTRSRHKARNASGKSQQPTAV